MCISVFGGSISHFLSAGRKKVKTTDLIDKNFIPYLLTNDDNIQLYLQNKRMHHKWTKTLKSLSSKFPIYPNCTKIRINELERKVKDYKNYPEKYSKCPEDIKDLVSIDEDESEEIE